ncbi:MAG: non-ribosomal peptide synthetase [Firmicutes bacterium]|nr:non-ribosomal peptide synthetase [Bacillota bacterium]
MGKGQRGAMREVNMKATCAKDTKTSNEIEKWLRLRLAERLKVEPSKIDICEPLYNYGLDSSSAVTITGEMGEWLGQDISPTLVWDYPTIEDITRFLTLGTGDSAIKNAVSQNSTAEPIAIIGIGCRFPGAEGPEAFWSLLKNNIDVITETPIQRRVQGKNASWGGYLNNIDEFDARFFGISPREAAEMDPQQRLLLEVSWEALEDAGQIPERLVGQPVGVFIGISGYDYGAMLRNFSDTDIYAATGNALSIAANRISYLFNFQGPSLAIDTACSSSLVAVHLACQSLRNGESKLALVGGVNLLLSPDVTAAFDKAGMLSSDGRCKTFSAEANGYVRGEGAGVVVLKPLSKALHDGDSIYALIPGSAVNQDGRSNGLTAPNGPAQEAVLREAYQRAGVSPGEIQYVEAHGTGTSLGDPIEAKALGRVLAEDRLPQNRCLIGSVKTNIGHLEAAAGMAGLIKVALALKHREIPASLHFDKPNPYIPFEKLPLCVQTETGPWPNMSSSLLAGVSSFGFGGTNAHVVLEGFQASSLKKHSMTSYFPRAEHLFAISAVDQKALRELAQSYRDYMSRSDSNISIKDICYTAGNRRKHHDYRMAMVVRSRQEMVEYLDNYLNGEAMPAYQLGQRTHGNSSKVVFVFSGQGSQWWAMGRELFQEEQVFREIIEECDELFRCHVDWSLITELTAEKSESRLDQTEVAQPVLFAVQVALAKLWMLWGIQPAAVVGHSMGELAAGYIAGALSLSDAVRVIFHRSRLMQRTTGQGKTVAVELAWDEAELLLAGYEDKISIACYNGPTSLVLSGEPAAMNEIMAKLEQMNVFCKALPVDYAFHSYQMEPLKDELTASLKGLQSEVAVLPIYSTVTGKVINGQQLNSAYWVKNLREPVLFATAVEHLVEDDYNAFLEISPHPVLAGAVRQSLNKLGKEGIILPSLRRQEPERACLLKSLGGLYTKGYQVNWDGLYPEGGKCIALPKYPWQREQYWFEMKEHKPIFTVDKFNVSDKIDRWLYKVEWKPKELRTYEEQAYERRAQGTWLVFAQRDGIGELAAQRLVKQGEKAIVVYPGEAFECLAEGVFSIRPDRKNLDRLVNTAFDSDWDGCQGILHTWGIGSGDNDKIIQADLEKSQTMGCRHVLELIQGIKESKKEVIRNWPRLWIVTRGSQAVSIEGEIVDFTQAPLWGLGRTIAVEEQELWGGLVDLDPNMLDENSAQMLVEDILVSSGEDQVAYRQGTRFVARLKQQSLGGEKDRSIGWQTNGTYLITGGLGDLGLTVAKWMVKQGARRLILLGRSKLPPRSAWDKVCETKDHLANKIDTIKELEAMGANIHLAAVDVADAEQIETFLTKFQGESWPPIRGVVHAAGIVDNQLLATCNPDAFYQVLRPKVEGAWLLHQLLKDVPLDFFILFSSNSALLSSPRLGSYAAANAFLDSLAHYRRSVGLPALSINWGPWAEIGMAARFDILSSTTGMGISSISPEQGLEMLGFLIGKDITQVAVMEIDWVRWKMVSQQDGKTGLLADLLQEEGNLVKAIGNVSDQDTSIRQALIAANKSERYKLLEKYLCDQVAQVLRLANSKLDVSVSLTSLGLDSIMAVELKNRIEKALDIIVPMVNFLQGPSVTELAAQIQTLLTLDSEIAVIPIAPKQEVYPVSSAQKRMFILNQFEVNDTSYNNSVAFMIEGALDIPRFENVIKSLIQRHETLRTSFEIIDGETVQRIHESIEFAIDFIHGAERDIPNIIQEFVQPFDLSKAPLFRVGLVELTKTKYMVVFDMHHIISDGVTAAIFIKELASLYEGLELPDLRIQYKDFAIWQNSVFQTEDFRKQEEYWLQNFVGELPVLNMPSDYPRPPVRSFEGAVQQFSLDEKLTGELNKLSRENGTTLYMVLLAAYNVVLAKYTGQEDIVVGSPIAGRQYADLHNIIGVFINTLAMRNFPEKDKSFLEFLQKVKENALSAYEHQDYPFEELVDKLDIPRDLSRNPLFDTMFALQSVDMAELTIGSLRFSRYEFYNRIAKFDLTVEAIERNNRLDFTLEYDTKLFKQETVQRLKGHLETVLKAIVEQPEIKLADIELVSEAEKQQLLFDYNNTKTDYPKDKTIQEIFEDQVAKNPDNIAIVFKEQKLTYKELNNKANKLALALRNKGVKAGRIVGMMVERSPEMIIAIMGILKAGGACLPIDPEYPEERISYILEDSRTNILLTQRHLVQTIAFAGDIIAVDAQELYQGEAENPIQQNTAQDLAYIIYTSGSTGKPKGNLTMHHNVVRVVKETNYIKVTDHDVLLQLSNYAFDGSVFDIYGALLNGAKLVLLDKETVLDMGCLAKVIEQEKVTAFFITTALFNTLVDVNIECLKNIRKVLFGGEQVSVRHVQKAFEYLGSGRIVHVYGPTETTVFATYYEVNHSDPGDLSVPIGAPIANTVIYILDQGGNLQPVGVPGELCIAGDGLARGYLNRPELTAEKFVANPFAPGERMYRTGDLAKWLPDGNIEFLGRIDHQVKIRGFRIELGEIEAEILKHPDIKETCVMAKDDPTGQKYLCAYVVAEDAFDARELKAYLRNPLPDYMVPTSFVQLEKLPLTPNGKVDRKVLPEPEGRMSGASEYVAPRNEAEEKLTRIWQEVLGVERIGIEDNFFELGGQSLKAITLVAKIHKTFGVEVPLQEVFKAQTIKALSQIIQNVAETDYIAIEPVAEAEYYPVSSAQKRMFILNQFENGDTAYNMPAAFKVEGAFDKKRFEEAWEKLVQRHEALRTSFELSNGEPVQRVHEAVAFSIGQLKGAEKDIPSLFQAFVHPFDLSKAPLFRINLVGIAENQFVMFFDMHHIISDGVSMEILVKELTRLYKGEELPELRVQYKDFSAWQNSLFTTERFKQQEKYWLQTFDGELPVLSLPNDYPRPQVRSFEGDQYEFALGEEVTEKLNKLVGQTGVTMYMVLLAAYNVILSKYSGQEDVIIGTPIAGRPHADLENVVGMFVNTLAMRNYPAGDKKFTDFLQEVKKNALSAYAHQDYQFEELVDKLDIPRDLSRNPLFSTLFTLQNMDIGLLEIDSLKFSAYELDNNTAKFDLTLRAIERNNRLNFTLGYYSRLFKKETVEQFGQHFVNVLTSIVEQPEVRLAEIALLTEDERNRILVDLNNTNIVYPNKTIKELFELQVKRNPDSIAVTFVNQHLTYRELNYRANQFARVLRNKGVKPNSIIGLMAKRSLEMIVGIMGILKAGGAYLPIDPEYGAERIAYMLENSQSEIVLTQNDVIYKVPKNIVIIDFADVSIGCEDGTNLDTLNQPEDLAYVIYTSGTTGQPKGVMIENCNVVNLVYGLQDCIYNKYVSNLNVALLSPYVFDASIKQIFPALLSGHNLCIVPEDIRFDRSGLLNFYQKTKTDISDGTPAHIRVLNSICREGECLNVKEFLIGGEALSGALVGEFCKNFKNSKINITNVYGPTECCDIATLYKVDCDVANSGDIVPIGNRLPNVRIYILGKDLEVLPFNAVGEVYISGKGVGRGYINNLGLTAEKFVGNPFIIGERMYRTGDLGRQLPDGTIEFFGRVDHQVKIRGFRIELGEIEAKLLEHKEIKETIVVAREEVSGNKYLCAYIVANGELSAKELREHLGKTLPEYMIPSYFLQLEKLPLTLNGKIDRKALPKPEGRINTSAEYIAPRNEAEEKLAQIWQDVLGAEKVGIEDNFFELGGHSLKAINLVAKIHKAFGVEIPLLGVFKAQTIKELMEMIAGAAETDYAAIEPIAKAEYYPVSSAQKRMFILNQFKASDTTYNMPAVFKVEGKLDKQRFENAWKKLIERHETLRTSFVVIEGEPVQKVHDGEIQFTMDVIQGNEENIPGIVKAFVRPFDLGKAPLLRVGLVEVAETEHMVLFDMHHIISDGVSMRILVKELTRLYEGQELAELRIQYKDFSAWQNGVFKTEAFKKQEEYWLKTFNGEIPALNLPSDYSRPTVRNFAGDRLSFTVGEELTGKLNDLAGQNSATMYMVLLAAYNVMLAKYSGQEDIVIGSPIAGRAHADLEGIIGMFVNTLAMRNFPEKDKSFRAFLEEVKENALSAYEHQDYQFEELVDKLDIPRDLSRNPLFDTMFVLQNMDTIALEFKGLRFSSCEIDSKIAKFDLTLEAVERNNHLEFTLEYDTKLFKQKTVERLGRHFVNVLASIVEQPEIKLADIDIVSEAEKRQLLIDFNDTKMAYPKDKTIQELFEEQVAENPDHIAVVLGEQQLTYKELDAKANQLARVLRNKGVASPCIVGILAERSPELITGIMGILKAGGTYLPIDPEYPEDRISYMLADSESKILLAPRHLADKVVFSGEIIHLDDPSLYIGDSSRLFLERNPRDLAYVIYTSGSTGKPKGVEIEHTSLVNLVSWHRRIYNIKAEDRATLLAGQAFDAAVWEIWPYLTSGAGLYIPDNRTRAFTTGLIKWLKDNKITISFMPTPMAEALMNEEWPQEMALRALLTGGDKLHCRPQEMAFMLVNHYGPTESTVVATWGTVNPDEPGDVLPSIGRPVDNTQIYILDKNNKLQPVGVPGEMCIAGDGLARGYLNRTELTAEKFVVNPLVPGERMYRTGDLAKWLPDGNIEFLGRIDHQVKIRGFRIELGEIEAEILKHPAIKEACVLVKDDVGDQKYLCAYIVAEEALDVRNLKAYLRKPLPDYMVPTSFVQLEKLPLTPNGKIDRKALPEPEGRMSAAEEYMAPRNEAEEKLVRIWQEVLGAKKIGIEDNFFELGGQSLKAITLVAKIHKTFGVEVPLQEVFKAQTIKALSKIIDSLKATDYITIEPVAKAEYYPVSSAQKRMFILNQFENGDTAYNMPAAFKVEGFLDTARFDDCLNNLIQRHETLRTSFELVDGEPVQRVHEAVEFTIDMSKGNEQEISDILKAFVSPFDLSKAPLFRVKLVEIAKNQYVVLFDMHHIISDGVTMGILVEELAKLYEGQELAELRIQYKDFSAWQNNLVTTESFKQHEEYWLKTFAGELPVLSMPSDYQRPPVRSFEGARLEFALGEDVTKKLNKLAGQAGATMYMVLLAAYSVVLSKYSGQEDVIVGSPIAGRPHADLENVVGMFVNTLAMRNYPAGDKRFIEFLQEVKENALSAYAHQDYQFEELVDKLDIPRDLSRNPLFDTLFILQDTDIACLRMGDLNLIMYQFDNKTAKFDLICQAFERNNRLEFTLEYYSKLFKKETVERFGQHFVNVLTSIVDQPEVRLAEIALLAEAERRQILVEFNNTRIVYPNKTIQELFEEQAKKNPEKIAVVYEEYQLTYKELDKKANQLAQILRNSGVRENSIVGILAERSPEMIIGMMGILKAGGAYLPIDTEYPEDRISYMLEDSGTKILLTKKHLADKVLFSGEVIHLDDSDIYSGDGASLFLKHNPHDLAYVIYTSGSTGKPKGVEIEQISLVNLVKWHQRVYNITVNDRATLLAGQAFDASVWEIWPYLTAGAGLYIPDSETRASTTRLIKWLKDNLINISFMPTPMAEMLLAEVWPPQMALRALLTGGDKLHHQTQNLPFTLVNHYGPTESTVVATAGAVSLDESEDRLPSIGRPVDNTKIYIVDRNNNLQPVGVAGELCIAGDGLARGYLNRPELTAEKFVANPFDSGERMYRTGDLARWLGDGNIEFLGRIDQQVKIRGFRIELGEIEAGLLTYPAVKEAIVIVKDDLTNSKYLCAYIVAEDKLTLAELRDHLAPMLPEYMLPTSFVQLDRLPLTPNGKIDRKALPQPERISAGKEYVAPRNEAEEKLVWIWQEVLGVEKVGIEDNFFELGGHSLKAITLAARIHKEFGIEVPLQELFKAQTIKNLIVFIEGTTKVNYAAIKPVPEQDYYPVSSAQKRMFVLNQFEDSQTAYNMPAVLKIEGVLDKERFEAAWKKLIQRHETLRTSFGLWGGEPVQRVHQEVAFTIDIIQGTEHCIQNIIKAFRRPFDLSKAPLIRVNLVEMDENKHLLLFDMHHIISDGVSIGILVKELASLYEEQNLAEIKIQYKDFAVWQNDIFKTKAFKMKEAYWLKVFEGEIPLLNIPSDYPRPMIRSFEGNRLSFNVGEDLTGKLNKIAGQTDATIYMVLLAAYNILLAKHTGQEDIVVGTPIAGRQHADLENLVGMFVNTLAMRNYPSGNKSFKAFLHEIKENALLAYENQDYQFEELVEKLDIARDLGRNPLFDTMFVLQNMDMTSMEMGGLTLVPVEIDNKTAKVDLTLYAVEGNNGLELMLEYCTKLFTEETAARLLKDYCKILKEITDNDDILIKMIMLEKQYSKRRGIKQSLNFNLAAQFGEAKAGSK